MSIHNLCLISASVLVLTNAANATGPKIDPAPNFNNSTHTYTQQLKPISQLEKAYQIAKIQFLPDAGDDLGFSGSNGIGQDHNSGNSCSGFPLTSCPANGNCSQCSFGAFYKLNNCKSGFTKSGNSCTPASCSSINASYLATIPANKICTKITANGLTCFKDCRAVSCTGYTLNCDAFTIANSASKDTCADCSSADANCSPKLCKVGTCQDGYKLAENATQCVALDDTCSNGYFKTCETGTTGEPQYTEKGTACYKCKPNTPPSSIGHILYSDLTTSPDIISGKTPIGIIAYASGNNYQAISLDQRNNYWGTSNTDNSCISNTNTPSSDYNGRQNTNCVKSQKSSYPAFSYCIAYSTTGTQSDDWYLPAAGELQRTFSNVTVINNQLSTLKKTKIENQSNNFYDRLYDYWSSSEQDYYNGWRYSISEKKWLESNKPQGYHFTRCYLQLTKCGNESNRLCLEGGTFTLPILYSDLTTSTEKISGKTPIGVVFDESKKLAIALDMNKKSWASEYFDIPAIDNTSEAVALTDLNGKKNTKAIIDYCKANSKSCPAAKYAYEYSTAGTQPGNWYLPAQGELNAIYTTNAALLNTLSKIMGTQLGSSYLDDYWSSSEYSGSNARYQHIGNGTLNIELKVASKSVVPVINYGDMTITPDAPVCSVSGCKECVSGSTTTCKTCKDGYGLLNGTCQNCTSSILMDFQNAMTQCEPYKGDSWQYSSCRSQTCNPYRIYGCCKNI